MQTFDNYSHTPTQPTKHHFAYRLLKCCVICLCALCLSGCFIDGTSSENKYFWDTPNDYNYSTQPYPEEYDSSFNTSYHNNNEIPYPQNVVVPESYHLGIANTPPVSKDEDRRWIEQQNPRDYTIQVTKNPRPAAVANTLQQMPKSSRSAEARSQSGSYVGVHGSYSTREEAETELNKLPPSVKGQAQVKNWQAVQSEVQ